MSKRKKTIKIEKLCGTCIAKNCKECIDYSHWENAEKNIQESKIEIKNIQK